MPDNVGTEPVPNLYIRFVIVDNCLPDFMIVLVMQLRVSERALVGLGRTHEPAKMLLHKCWVDITLLLIQLRLFDFMSTVNRSIAPQALTPSIYRDASNSSVCSTEGTRSDTFTSLRDALLENLHNDIDIFVRAKDIIKLLIRCLAENALGALV